MVLIDWIAYQYSLGISPSSIAWSPDQSTPPMKNKRAILKLLAGASPPGPESFLALMPCRWQGRKERLPRVTAACLFQMHVKNGC